MSDFLNGIRNKHNEIFTFLLLVACTVSLLYIFPREAKFKYEFQEGSFWKHDDLFASHDFSILKQEDEIESEKDAIRSSTPPVYIFDNAIANLKTVHFEELIKNKWEESQKSEDGSGLIAQIFIGEEKSQENYEHHLKVGREILESIYSKGLVDIIEQHESDGSLEITIINNNIASTIFTDEIYSFRTATSFVEQEINSGGRLDKKFLNELLHQALEYNVSFNQEKTDLIIQEKINEISTRKGKISEGELIIAKGDIVDEEKFIVLSTLKTGFENKTGGSEKYWIVILGQFILISLCMISVVIFLRLFNKKLLSQPHVMMFLLILLVLNALMAKVSLQLDILNIYIAPICIVPIIIRAFFKVKIALYLHIISVFIVSFIVPNPYEFVFLQIIAGLLLLFGISNLRKRAQFFNSSFVIFGSYSVTYLGLNLIHQEDLNNIEWMNYAWFGGNALLSLFAYPLIYMFEKSFGLLSEMSLLELSDSNSKLLRRLNENAPGTFQHTLQVANMAEEAIRTIGGNALLVRAGAMYHDIGKLDKPHMFIENQNTKHNPHDELPPTESAEIILNHVIKGIELGRKHKLPDQIIDFIRTHHGLTRVEYFYRQMINQEGEENVDKSKFTYPGPLPYSKETVVLMMADSTEAASKSLKNPNSESIDNLVEKIIEGQMNAGQYVNANITFKEISEIKTLFKRKLKNIYHIRIEYPE